jgi:hypothetical protein
VVVIHTNSRGDSLLSSITHHCTIPAAPSVSTIRCSIQEVTTRVRAKIKGSFSFRLPSDKAQHIASMFKSHFGILSSGCNFFSFESECGKGNCISCHHRMTLICIGTLFQVMSIRRAMFGLNLPGVPADCLRKAHLQSHNVATEKERYVVAIEIYNLFTVA